MVDLEVQRRGRGNRRRRNERRGERKVRAHRDAKPVAWYDIHGQFAAAGVNQREVSAVLYLSEGFEDQPRPDLGANPDARAMGNKRPLDWACKPGSGRKADDEATVALLQSWAGIA